MAVSTLILISILVLGLVYFSDVHAACNVCQQENGVACVNQTSFHPCFGDVRPDTSQTFHCTDGLECTNLPNICFQKGASTPSCEDLSKCGVCNENNVFACTSQTSFALCFGAGTPSDILGTCPVGYACDYSSSSICVPRHEVTTLVCDV